MAYLPSASFAVADSRTLSFSPAITALGSCPWHARHLFERIGRMSRLKSILVSIGFPPTRDLGGVARAAKQTRLPLASHSVVWAKRFKTFTAQSYSELDSGMLWLGSFLPESSCVNERYVILSSRIRKSEHWKPSGVRYRVPT